LGPKQVASCWLRKGHKKEALAVLMCEVGEWCEFVASQSACENQLSFFFAFSSSEEQHFLGWRQEHRGSSPYEDPFLRLQPYTTQPSLIASPVLSTHVHLAQGFVGARSWSPRLPSRHKRCLYLPTLCRPSPLRFSTTTTTTTAPGRHDQQQDLTQRPQKQ